MATADTSAMLTTTTAKNPPLPVPLLDPDDLLSGFDKAVAAKTFSDFSNNNHTATAAFASSISNNLLLTEGGDDIVIDPQQQHSPPFTSQSFDDFHRFLGKDLSLLEEEEDDEEDEETAVNVVSEDGGTTDNDDSGTGPPVRKRSKLTITNAN